MSDEIYESLIDICNTLQTLKEQIEVLAYSFIPEDEDMDISKNELRIEEEE